jgi:hypothetical protein
VRARDTRISPEGKLAEKKPREYLDLDKEKKYAVLGVESDTPGEAQQRHVSSN